MGEINMKKTFISIIALSMGLIAFDADARSRSTKTVVRNVQPRAAKTTTTSSVSDAVAEANAAVAKEAELKALANQYDQQLWEAQERERKLAEENKKLANKLEASKSETESAQSSADKKQDTIETIGTTALGVAAGAGVSIIADKLSGKEVNVGKAVVSGAIGGGGALISKKAGASTTASALIGVGAGSVSGAFGDKIVTGVKGIFNKDDKK